MFGYDDRRKTQAILYAVVGIVLLMASFVLPWWGLYSESESRRLDPDEPIWHSETGFGVSISSGISYQGGGTSLYNLGHVTSVVYSITAMLMVLALIFASLMIAGLMLDFVQRKIKSRLPMMFGVFAVFFCLLAPIVFMIALPIALEADAREEAERDGDEYEEPEHDDPTKSFFGTFEDEDDDGWRVTSQTRRWGGDIGWVLSFVSAVFFIIAVIMIKPRKMATPPPGYPVEVTPQQMPQPPHVVRQTPPPPPTG
jgi:hypothetical protein